MRKIPRTLFFLMVTGLFLMNYSEDAISVPSPNTARTQVEKRSERQYRLPGHGLLELSVPESWQDEVRQPPFELPPTITMRSRGGNDFVLMITPLWSRGEEDSFNSENTLKEIIQHDMESMKTRSAEAELLLHSIKGPETYGYYYMARDKALKPDEWEYVLRMGVGCRELLILATLLTHDRNSPAVGATLEAFRKMKQISEETLRSEGKFDFRYPPMLESDAQCAPPTHEQKMWALATCALITETNRAQHDLLGGCERTPEEINRRRINLANWWGIRNRDNLIETLRWIEEGGHRKGFDEMRQYIKALPSEEKKAYLKQLEADPEMNNKLHVISYYRFMYGDKSIVAWDYARYTVLCGWGYVAGYFNEEEAWGRMLPAARLLQQTFDSWEDLGRNYMIGREFWSLSETRRNGEAMAKAFRRLRTHPDSPWKTIPWELDLTPKDAPQATAEEAP